jgi:hypothetical protein
LKTGTCRKDEEVPSLEEIQELRESVVGWIFLCNRLLPAVVGTTTWERRVAIQQVSEFTTVSDVAFCLLALENNWDYWQHVASVDPTMNNRTTYPATKWTSSPVIGGKNTGWSEEGLHRFNELCQLEAKDREENSSVEYEFLVKKQRDNIARNKQSKTVVVAAVSTYVDEHALNY